MYFSNNLNYKFNYTIILKWKRLQKFSALWRLRSPKLSASNKVSQKSTLTFPSLEYHKVVTSKQTMAGKKSENEMVLAEFKMLDDDANVYKLVGPILAK